MTVLRETLQAPKTMENPSRGGIRRSHGQKPPPPGGGSSRRRRGGGGRLRHTDNPGRAARRRAAEWAELVEALEGVRQSCVCRMAATPPVAPLGWPAAARAGLLDRAVSFPRLPAQPAIASERSVTSRPARPAVENLLERIELRARPRDTSSHPCGYRAVAAAAPLNVEQTTAQRGSRLGMPRARAFEQK